MPSRLILILIFMFSLNASLTYAEDGIPDNCEYPYAEYYHANVFPRYEPQNRRLVLVDWNNGAVLGVLGSDLGDTIIRGWSANCRYLAVATGDAASRDTVVYDTVEMRLVGRVPDARIIPHPISWGPHEFLVVEGRAGAVLWNVPQNIQYHLDVGFSEITNRNFSRLRWDADHYQLTANFSDGGRAVYDLRTGQPTIAVVSRPGEIVIGGERFACQPTRSARGGASVSGLWLRYAHDSGVIYLGRGWAAITESLATIEAGLPPTRVQPLGWSINCRYVAAALDSTERDDTYDTVIWDFIEGRRVGVYPDARDLPHRLTWDTAEKHALVETRNGAYLWNLLTNERVLVNANVSTITAPNCYYAACYSYSFERVYWDAGREQMLGVPVQAPNAVVAYDVHTGQEVTRYTVEGASEPLDFITSDNSRLLLTEADGYIRMWDRETGAIISLTAPNPVHQLSGRAAVSPDNRYLAINQGVNVWVWDLNAGAASPAYTHDVSKLGYRWWGTNIYFANADTLDSGNTYSQMRLNVVSGEFFGSLAEPIDPQAQVAQSWSESVGTSGYGWEIGATVPGCPLAVRYNEQRRQLILHDTRTSEQRIIEADLNNMRKLFLSPDCQSIFGEVRVMNTALPYDETPADDLFDYQRAYQFVLWDIASGERLATLDTTRGKNQIGARVWWNPDGSRALVDTGAGYFLIHPANKSVLSIRFQDTDGGYLPRRMTTYWDHQRGLVLVAGFGEVFALDMQTGVERLRFPAAEGQRGGCYNSQYAGCGMKLSPDGKWVFVFGNDALSAWNIDTLSNISVPVESGRFRTGTALVSPDERYLVLSRSAVRVWDMTTLPEVFDERLPIATYGVGAEAVLSLRFADAQTLEVITRTTYGTAAAHYDLLTGQLK